MNPIRLWFIRKILNFLFGQHITAITPTPHLGIVVVKCETYLSSEAFDRIRASFERALPGQRVIILERGMDITVL